MGLEELLQRATDEGVTMIVLDKGYCTAWHKGHKKTFVGRNRDRATAMRQALEAAIDPNYDPEILV